MNKRVDTFARIVLLAVLVLLLCSTIGCSKKDDGESMFVWVPTYAVNTVWPEYLDSYKPGSTQTVLGGPGSGLFPSRITEKNPVTGQEEEFVFLLVPIRFLDIEPNKGNLATPERHGRGLRVLALGTNLEWYGIHWTDFRKAMQSAKKVEQAKRAYKAVRTASEKVP
jgi:hypothetical protein